ncbi:outer membrane beta-barrel protein [Aliiglaciecola sp.]|nr:outer membrane beta-barrel protein [Aliiglaciecola sp.]
MRLRSMIEHAKKQLLACTTIAAISVVSTSPVNAQQKEGFIPEVEISLGEDDNIYRTSDSISDSIINVSPTMTLTELYGKFKLNAQYKGSYNFYSDFDELDYQDHSLSVSAQTSHSARFSSEILVSYKDVIEQPGSTNAITAEINEFNQTSEGRLLVSGAYGTRDSIGQIVVSFDKTVRGYDNNEQSFRDYDTNKFTSTFFYRAAPKTRFLFEASTSDLAYDNTEPFDLSSTQDVLLAGVEWTATAKTTSVFKIGYQDVDYKSDDVEDIQGLSYFLDMYWKPNTYSTVRIGASRATRESAEQSVGGFISTQYGVGVEHEFTSVTKLDVNLSFIEDDIASSGDRNDESTELKVKFVYAPKYWLKVFAGFELHKRDSSFEIYNFDANVYRLGVIASFD